MAAFIENRMDNSGNYGCSETANQACQIDKIETLVNEVKEEFDITVDFFKSIIDKNVYGAGQIEKNPPGLQTPVPSNKFDRIIERARDVKTAIKDFRMNQLENLDKELSKL